MESSLTETKYHRDFYGQRLFSKTAELWKYAAVTILTYPSCDALTSACAEPLLMAALRIGSDRKAWFEFGLAW
jgi:hypothetical protein